jgi:hypothetical protein
MWRQGFEIWCCQESVGEVSCMSRLQAGGCSNGGVDLYLGVVARRLDRLSHWSDFLVTTRQLDCIRFLYAEISGTNLSRNTHKVISTATSVKSTLFQYIHIKLLVYFPSPTFYLCFRMISSHCAYASKTDPYVSQIISSLWISILSNRP